MAAGARDSAPERWGEDPRLVALLGERGCAGFRALLDDFPDPVGILWPVKDDDGAIVDFNFGYGNPAILRAFRIRASTHDRYTLLEALPQMRGSHAFDAYLEVCASGEPWVEEVTYDTPFGDGYMLGTYVQRTARLGDGLINFLTDVTAQRRMEAELKSYADVVAHDLREPVTAVAFLLTLLEQHAGEPPPDDVLRLMRASTDRALELVDGVLSYARVGEVEHERVELSRLVSEVAEDLRPAFEEAGATLEAGELPVVEGDPRQLRRLLQNLVANAVKFRGEDPARIELSALRGSEEWVVTVRDNGIGVDRDRAGAIFGMFQSDGGAGAGIGLAVSRRIVEAHGGRIWVEPAESGGSEFRFTLPL